MGRQTNTSDEETDDVSTSGRTAPPLHDERLQAVLPALRAMAELLMMWSPRREPRP